MSKATLFFVLVSLSANFLSANVISNQNETTRIFENEIIETLECLRGVLKTGIEEVGLPSIEPLEIPHITLNVSNLGIPVAAGYVTVENVVVAGITNWELSDLKVSLNLIGGLGLKVEGKINLPLLDIYTEYVTDLAINGMKIFGDGDLSLVTGQVGFALDAKMLLTKINLAKFRLLPSIETVKFKITGLLNDEEHSAMASQIVNEVAVPWINEKSEDFASFIEEFLQGLINQRSILKESYIDIEEIINAILERCPIGIGI